MKYVDIEGNKKCRVYKNPPSLAPNFIPTTADLFEEKDYDYLEYAGFATKNEEGKWIVDKDLIGGKHTYPAFAGEHRLPTNPLLFFVIRSSANVQVSPSKNPPLPGNKWIHLITSLIQ